MRRAAPIGFLTPDSVFGRVAALMVAKKPNRMAVISELHAVVAARLVAPEYNPIYFNLMHYYRTENYLDLRIDARDITLVEIQIFELACNRILQIAQEIETGAYVLKLPSARKEMEDNIPFAQFYAGVFALARDNTENAEGHFRLAGDYWEAKGVAVADQIIGEAAKAEAMLGNRFARIKAILIGKPIPGVVNDAPPAPPPPGKDRGRPPRPPIREIVTEETDRSKRRSSGARSSREVILPIVTTDEGKLPAVDRSADRPLIIAPQKLVDEAKALVVPPDREGSREQAAHYKREAERLNSQGYSLAAISAALEAISHRSAYQPAIEIIGRAVRSIYQSELSEKADAYVGIEFAEALLLIKPDEAKAIVRIAHYLGRLRRVSDAEKALARARGATKNTEILAYADMVEARICFYAREYDKTLAIITRFNLDHPYFRDSLVLRFRAYAELKQFMEGLAFLDSIKGLHGLLAQNFHYENRGVFLRQRGIATQNLDDLKEAYVCYHRAYLIVAMRTGDKFGPIYDQKKQEIAAEIRAMGGEVPDVSKLRDEASIPQRIIRQTPLAESPVVQAEPRVVRDIRKELGMASLPGRAPVSSSLPASEPVPSPMPIPAPAPVPERDVDVPVPSFGAVEQMRLRVQTELVAERELCAGERAEIDAARLAISQEREALEREKAEHALQMDELAADRAAFEEGKQAVAEELGAKEDQLQEREATLDERESQLERIVQRRYERQVAELAEKRAAVDSLGTWLDGLAAHLEADFRRITALQGAVVTALTDAAEGKFDMAVVALRPVREGFPGSEIPVAARAVIGKLREVTAENKVLRQQPTPPKSAAAPASRSASVQPELVAVRAELETAKASFATLQAELARVAAELSAERAASAGLRAQNEALLQTAAALTARLKAAKPVTETETLHVQIQPNPAFETVWNRIAQYSPELLAQQNPLIQQLFTYEQKARRGAIPIATVIDRRRRIFAIIIDALNNGKTPTTSQVQAADREAFNNGYINQAFRAFPTFGEHIAAAQAILVKMREKTV
ncbi:MAG: hypothetical protein WC890_04225 [Candidatus Margulisiibacteriota bacterium]